MHFSAQGDQALLQIALDLSASLPSGQLYQRLILAVSRVFPCDAAALLILQGEQLVPVALHGLAPELIGQRFDPAQHPRLQQILASRTPIRFAADTPLPDPFDGQLAADPERRIDVHDCMGCSLYVEDTLVGALTLDALTVGAFDQVDDISIATFSALAAATLRNARLMEQLRQAREQQQAIAQELVQEAKQREGEIIGQSEAIDALRQEINTVAQSDLAVLITGETGTGKELVARTVHACSQRNQQPLVHINCAALPPSVAESELFGHVKGAFTGAIGDRKGKFELADGGTLFLDEIGELPLDLQAKLLRALQQGEIQRIGSDSQRIVDVRIIAATNRYLADEVAKGRFRSDLYHRLRVFPLQVPALREHKSDLPILSGHFLNQAQHKLGVEQIGLHPEALLALQHYNWPGNVRELEHLLLRAALKARQGNQKRILIKTEHLELSEPTKEAPSDAHSALTAITTQLPPGGLREGTEDYQRLVIRQALAENDGIWKRAASALQMDRGNLYRLAKRLGL